MLSGALWHYDLADTPEAVSVNLIPSLGYVVTIYAWIRWFLHAHQLIEERSMSHTCDRACTGFNRCDALHKHITNLSLLLDRLLGTLSLALNKKKKKSNNKKQSLAFSVCNMCCNYWYIIVHAICHNLKCRLALCPPYEFCCQRRGVEPEHGGFRVNINKYIP